MPLTGTKITESTSFFQRTKANFLSKSPYRKWITVRKFNMFLLKLSGSHVMLPEWKCSIRFMTPGLVIANMFTLMVYTMFYYQNDLMMALQATVIIALVIPSLVCYILGAIPSSREMYRRMYNFGGDFIYANSQISEEINSVCDRMAIDLVIKSFIVNGLISLSLGLAIFSPIQKIILTGEDVLIIPIMLPYFDVVSKTGYIINTINHIAICAFGAAIIPALELVTVVIKNNAAVMAEVTKATILEFTTKLKRRDDFTMEKHLEFRNIILKIVDFERYVVSLTDFYYWKFFLQPITSMYSITVSLFLYLEGQMRINQYLSIAICYYIQLLILCDIGKAIDDANDVIWDTVDEFPFYKLPLIKQRLIVLSLGRVQNAQKITIGPFSELNYAMSTKLTKMIYSYLMCMHNLNS